MPSGAAKEASEARREVTVAGKPSLERNSREIIAAVENSIEAARETLVQNIVVDRGADHLPEDVTEMERR
jgi:hypothetical protein